MTNWDKFIEAVKAGEVEGLAVVKWEDKNTILTLNGNPIANMCFDDWHLHTEGKPYIPDHLCAHIRRWLTGKGWCPVLFTTCLSVGRPGKDFREGSELDWHIDACLWVLESELPSRGEVGK